MLARLAALALLLPVVVQAGTFEKPVIPLGPKEFNKVMKDDRMSMVVFYAPWCGHCKSLAPEYAQAATSLGAIIPFYSVDCDEDANKPLCAKYDVKGFPTIKGFTRGAKIPPKDYTGERKRAGLVGWASSMVGDKVKKMKVPAKGGVSAQDGLKEIESFLKADSAKMHVFLVHPTAASVPLMWKSLSQQSFATHSLGYIRDAEGHVRSALGLPVDDKPKVVFWPKGASDPAQQMSIYDGPLKFTELHTFLTTGSVPSSSPGSPSGSSSPSPATPAEPAPPNASQLQRAADRARAEARWAEEERRDAERRERMAARKRAAAAEQEDESTGGTGTEEAQPAEPASPPSASESAGGEKKQGGEPEPAGSAAVETEAAGEARETGRESILTEEQEEVVRVLEDNVGGQDEEVEPELKVVELEVEEERKRDEL